MTEVNVNDQELSFLAHLVELRSRLLKACSAVLIVLVFLLPFSRKLYALLAAPLTAVLPEGSSMIAIDVASPFLVPFKLCLLLALLLSMPVVMYQLWAFVAPALYKQEKRLARPLLYAAVFHFYTGGAFAYFLVGALTFVVLAVVRDQADGVLPDEQHRKHGQ